MTGVYGVFTVGVFRSVLLFGFSVVGWLYLLSVVVALLPYSLLLNPLFFACVLLVICYWWFRYWLFGLSLRSLYYGV